METENITNAEWEIMRVVWTKKATTSSEISDLLAKRLSWKPSTVKTLLNRLVEKNFLATEKSGKKFIYSAKVTENQSTVELVGDIKEKLCQRKIPMFVEELIESSLFTPEDLEMLAKLIERKKATAVTKIPCNCLPDKTEHCQHCQ